MTTQKSALFATLVIALLAVNTVSASDVYLAPTMTVSAEGSVNVVPDIARLTFGITELGNDVETLQQSVDRHLAQIVEYLESLSIDSRDINSTFINISPRYRYTQATNQRVREGFDVSRSVNLTLRDLSQLPIVMAGVTRLGVNTVSSPQLLISDEELHYQEALVLAVKAAKARAQVMATGADVDILGVSSIVQTVRGGYSPMPVARMAMAADSAEAARYDVGTQAVTASVTVEFLIDN